MAKRHKAHRGGRRGGSHGRGGSSRGRGGYRGRGGGRGGFARGTANTGGSFPELMNFDDNIYIPGENRPDPRIYGRRGMGLGAASMRMEALYTEQHEEVTLSGPLRKRPPIVFVKAAETYDPSKLVRQLFSMKLQSGQEEDKTEDFADITKDIDTLLESDEEMAEEPKAEVEVEAEAKTVLTAQASVPVLTRHQPDFECESDFESASDPQVGSDSESEMEQEQEQEQESDYDSEIEQGSESESDVEVMGFEIDTEGDPRLTEKRISVLNMKLPSMEPQKAMYIPTPQYKKKEKTPKGQERVVRVGGVEFNMDDDEDGISYIDLPGISKRKFKGKLGKFSNLEFDDEDFDFDDNESIDDIYQDFIDNASMGGIFDDNDDDDDDDDDEEEDAEPEFGTLPEDFIDFDITSIKVEGVRHSASTSEYNVESEPLFGDSFPRWTSKEDLGSMMMNKGLVEDRLGAFFRFVLQDMKDDLSEPEPDYDYPFSDTEEEEEDGEEDDDSLQDLVNFNFNRAVHHELPPTQSLKTKGKGKKRHLDTSGLQLDPDIIKLLEAKYEGRKLSKREKKLAKRQDMMFDEKNLNVKYPEAMTIQEIYFEIDEFYKDSNRSVLEFPSFDHHGQMTIGQIAKAFNMKARTFGNGKDKEHAVLIKKSSTYNSIPNYGEAQKYLHRRRFFQRSEFRSRKEFDGSKSKSKVFLKEGEVVGAEAPEIGQENIGRRILEKLGWQKGSGLGVENKGISEPILATMKKGKSGIR